ncbi:MAG: hypothetical protein KDB01_01810 [Planctomycetaceae bacterium]|nr:hypothetical protein [Planctomycetaceae bacterium]
MLNCFSLTALGTFSVYSVLVLLMGSCAAANPAAARIVPGMRMMVVRENAEIQKQDGTTQKIRIGDVFRIRMETRPDGRVLVDGDVYGEGHVSLEDLSPISSAGPQIKMLLEASPGDADLTFAFAKLNYYDDLTAAIPLLRASVTSLPRASAPRLYLAAALHRTGSPLGDVMSLIREARETSPDDPWTLSMIAYFCRSFPKIGAAVSVNETIRDLRAAIGSAPAYRFPRSELVYLYMFPRQGLMADDSLARMLIDEGLAVDPRNDLLHNLKGVLLLRRGNQSFAGGDRQSALAAYSLAEAEFRTALQLNNFDSTYMSNLATTQWNKADLQIGSEEDVVVQRLDAMHRVNHALFRNWRHSHSITEINRWLGSASPTRKSAFAFYVRKNLAEASEASRLEAELLSILFKLDPTNLADGMQAISHLDVEMKDADSDRELRMMANSLSGKLSLTGVRERSWPDASGPACSALDILVREYPSAAIWALVSGANPNVSNPDGSKPVHSLVQKRNPEIDLLDMLLAFGADSEVPDAAGRSPLALSLESGNFLAARLLRTFDAKWGEKDSAVSPLSVARKCAAGTHHVSDGKDADNWLNQKCVDDMNERIRVLVEWYSSFRELKAPSLDIRPQPFRDSGPVYREGIHPHDWARQQNAAFNRWFNDQEYWKKTETELQAMVNQIKIDKSALYRSHSEILGSLAIRLLPAANADAMIHRLNDVDHELLQ